MRRIAPIDLASKPRSIGAGRQLSAARVEDHASKAGRSARRCNARSPLPARPVPSAPHPQDIVEPSWQVVDDFSGDIPVMQAEIQVIETYLAGLLDKLLAPKKT